MTDIDEDIVTSFFGVRTDRLTRFWNPHMEFWKHVGSQKISTQSTKLELAVDRFMPPRMTGMHNYMRATG